MTSKKKRKLIASLAVVLVAIMTIGATYMYFTDVEEVTNKFVVGDLDIEVVEPGWEDPDPDKPEEPFIPGDVTDKDPSVELTKGVGAYVRFIMTFENPDGSVITDADRIKLIEDTIYYDPANILKTGNTKDGYGDPDYDIKDQAYTWTKAELAALLGEKSIYGMTELNSLAAGTDTDNGFVLDAVRTAAKGAGYYVYNYVNTKDDGVHQNVLEKKDGKIELFTKIVIPADYNNQDMVDLGKYNIVIKAEAIQDEGFANAEEAYTQLDIEGIAVKRVEPNP